MRSRRDWIRIHTSCAAGTCPRRSSYIWFYQLGGAGIRRVEYEATEHYRIYRDFLENRGASLRILLEDEE